MEKKIISSREAARQLGVPPQMVRERMKSGEWPIGTVRRSKKYDVYQSLLDDLIAGKMIKKGARV